MLGVQSRGQARARSRIAWQQFPGLPKRALRFLVGVHTAGLPGLAKIEVAQDGVADPVQGVPLYALLKLQYGLVLRKQISSGQGRQNGDEETRSQSDLVRRSQVR